MKYEKICKGIFIERPNRFVAHVQLKEKIVPVHVKNTGRCRELLLPGTPVILEDFTGRMGSRKLAYSLISVEKNVGGKRVLVNMDSQAPNQVVREAFSSGILKPGGMGRISAVRGEYTYGESRLDFYLEDQDERSALVEVKGVTLEEDGVARFPDAPTLRGLRHVKELIAARNQGYLACIIFVIQMKTVRRFQPNDRTQPEFGRVLKEARAAGVEILAYDCCVKEDELVLDSPVEVQL